MKVAPHEESKNSNIMEKKNENSSKNQEPLDNYKKSSKRNNKKEDKIRESNDDIKSYTVNKPKKTIQIFPSEIEPQDFIITKLKSNVIYTNTKQNQNINSFEKNPKFFSDNNLGMQKKYISTKITEKKSSSTCSFENSHSQNKLIEINKLSSGLESPKKRKMPMDNIKKKNKYIKEVKKEKEIGKEKEDNKENKNDNKEQKYEPKIILVRLLKQRVDIE